MGFWGQVSFLCRFRDRKEPWSSDSSSVQYHIPLNYQTITVYFLTMSHLVIESPIRELSTGTRGFSLWTTHAFLSTGKGWFKTNPQETFGYHNATTSKISYGYIVHSITFQMRPFTNSFHVLFTRWTCEINPKDLGTTLSGELGYQLTTLPLCLANKVTR